VYFGGAEEAAALGFRACKRCRPELVQSELLRFQKETVERLLTLAKTQPWKTIGELAQELALSRRQLERTTIAVTGLPPRRLIDQQRANL
jgi:methylphosphotriester-DNA--protein-cysteine methyltransferase